MPRKLGKGWLRRRHSRNCLTRIAFGVAHERQLMLATELKVDSVNTNLARGVGGQDRGFSEIAPRFVQAVQYGSR